MPIIRLLPAVIISLLAAYPALADNWPQFRGPGGQGESAEKNLPIKWSATDNVAWKTEIAGWGWSSPIVWGDRIFMTATSEDGISCHVVCVERKAGKILWDNEVFKQKPTRLQFKNSYATPTPVTDGTLVYVIFMEGGIAALNFDGKIAWTNFDYPFYNQHGMGTSPIVYKDLLIIPFDTSATTGDLKIGWQKPWDQSFVLALDKSTGKQRWKSGRGQSRIGHCMPRIAVIGGQTELISGAGDVLEAFDPDTGRLLWSVPNIGETVVPTPVFGDGMIFTESGFMDITIRAWRPGDHGEMTKSNLVWEFKKAVPTIPSYAFHDHRLYTIKEDGMLQCFEAATGKLLWKQRMEGHYAASPVVADGKIYLLSEEGTTTILDGGPELKVLADNALGEKCQASMAVSDGQFFIRTKEHLYCIATLKP
jgi:outer membrane protein assembly factor BamB